jgi:hypothetical protein
MNYNNYLQLILAISRGILAILQRISENQISTATFSILRDSSVGTRSRIWQIRTLQSGQILSETWTFGSLKVIWSQNALSVLNLKMKTRNVNNNYFLNV